MISRMRHGKLERNCLERQKDLRQQRKGAKIIKDKLITWDISMRDDTA